MTAAVVPKYTKTDWIKVAISFAIPVLIMFLPANEVLTPNAKKFLAITAWMLLWSAFTLTDLLLPALAYPILLVLAGVMDAEGAYSSWLGMTIPVIICAMVFGFGLDESGLLKRICYTLVVKLGGNFKRTMYAFFIACLVLSLATFAGASLIIATICFAFCKALDLKETKEACIVMMVGMLAGSTCRMFIYYPLTIMTLLGSTSSVDPTYTLTLVNIFLYNWPVLLFCLGFIWLMLRGKKNEEQEGIGGKSLEYFKAELSQLDKMSSREKKGAVLLIILVVSTILCNIVNINGFLPFIIIGLISLFPGIDVATTKSVKNLPLGTLFFVASCMTIGAGFTATGLSNALAGLMAAMMGDMNVIVLLLAVLLFGVIANFAMTPLAMLGAFGGALLTIANALGVNPDALMYTFLFSTDMVFLPYEYVTFLIFFSFGMMTTGQFVKYHAAKSALFAVFFLVIIIPYWFLVGLI